MKLRSLILSILAVAVISAAGLGQSKIGTPVTAKQKNALIGLIADDSAVKQSMDDPSKAAARLAKAAIFKKIDLNGDGAAEFLVTLGDGGKLSDGGSLCGTLGNCPMWVYGKSDGELLLRTTGRVLSIEKTSTNKYHDIRSEGGDTAFQGSFTIYAFDGTTYKPKECYNRIYGTKGKKDKIVAYKCEESS
jgi:hypothetical protein